MALPKNTLVIAIISLFLAGALIAWKAAQDLKISSINSFEECAAAGFPVMESFPEVCRTPDGRNFAKPQPPQNIMLSGQLVCLPHKDTGGPITLECAFGLRDDAGTHYGISDPEMKFVTTISMNETVTVSGLYSPVTDSKYDIVGNIEIESIDVVRQ